MRTTLASLSLCLGLALPAAAQTPNDIGLTMDGGILTVLYGQVCGPVGCQPFPGGSVGQGQSRTLTHYSAPISPYAVLLGLPGSCLPVPGVGNSLLLLPSPVAVLAIGTTSWEPFVPTPCSQGLAIVTLQVPALAPVGLMFRVQSIGWSVGGGLGFGPAIEATIR